MGRRISSQGKEDPPVSQAPAPGRQFAMGSSQDEMCYLSGQLEVRGFKAKLGELTVEVHFDPAVF